ncbi:MAG: diguanylate cyclase [Chloroflexota bacterium]|nr:DNA-binding response regulator [Chloroflexota bacterium]NOG64912.1 response regulator transcription factor [Chloroflexota bacterium]GIK66390.1 MAG: diguanylate cyclase [Chloroflexota bacterium]
MSKKRLLIIEDDADLAELLVTFFNSQGYEVLQADTGLEGIALARSKFPNLILLDVMLPDMQGFDVCQELRMATLTKYIPITFLTQRDARADKVAALELGADDYVTKPFDIEELRLRVQGSIRRATRDHLHEPRTGLPTGRLIQDEYERLRDREGWHYLSLKIAHFDAFRDLYGFIAADQALALAAKVLTETIATFGTQDDFIGSSGENTFAVFTHTLDIEGFRTSLIQNFKSRIESVYNFSDLEKGYIVVGKDTLQEERIPLMSIELTTHVATEDLDLVV